MSDIDKELQLIRKKHSDLMRAELTTHRSGNSILR